MYVKVRRIDGKLEDNEITITISKTAKIDALRELIYEKWNIESSSQRLFYKGKQLEDGYSIMDYDVQLNDVIQLMIRPSINKSSSPEVSETAPESKESQESLDPEESVDVESKYYKLNDKVDMQDSLYGAWFEYTLTLIKAKRKYIENGKIDERNIEFNGKWEVEPELAEFCANWKGIRPRARYTYSFNELSTGQTVLVNYNIEDPTARGYWYDMTIDEIKTQGGKSIIGTLHVGEGKIPLQGCEVKFINEIMRIEEPVLIKDSVESSNIPMRKSQYHCQTCKDNKKRKCKECGCGKCGGKNDPAKIILCDECDTGFHLFCLNPPLESIPEEENWYCPECKNDENEIVKAGEKLKVSKKKQKLVSKQNKEEGKSQRDWGKGMACVGRTKECTIVPSNHFGPIPGVDVGTCWKFRVQVSEAGVHRPHVAGIHGREVDGAYSIVLGGGYEDDIDDGNEFLYTGSGGRDLSGNKRQANQSCDQTLTRMNKALALNCNAKFNDKDGAEAKDWKGGKPVRVVRNAKLSKHSKFAPLIGNRYDGIYKVVKYYPVKGKSGFIVWRYKLRRDDTVPAPWEKGGQEFDVIYPEGYLEAKEKEVEKKEKGKKGKRKSDSILEDDDENVEYIQPKAKKAKLNKYTISESVQTLMNDDTANEKLWKECAEVADKGKQEFLTKVQDIFLCVCCQELVYNPITTECRHNVCKECLQRSFASQIYTCPYCRFDLTAKYKMNINDNLSKVLLELFPGYDSARKK